MSLITTDIKQQAGVYTVNVQMQCIVGYLHIFVFYTSMFDLILFLGKHLIMSTSKKMQDFTSEPMGEKPVKSLAGIGDVLGKKLEDQVSLNNNIMTIIIY